MKKWWWLINLYLILSTSVSCTERSVSNRKPNAGNNGNQTPSGTSSETQLAPVMNGQQNAVVVDSAKAIKDHMRDESPRFEAPKHGGPEQDKTDSIKKSKRKE